MREAENSSLERAVIGMVVVSVMNVDSSFLRYVMKPFNSSGYSESDAHC